MYNAAIEVLSPLTLGGAGDCGYCSNNTVLPPDSNDGVLRVFVTWEVAVHRYIYRGLTLFVPQENKQGLSEGCLLKLI